MKRRTRGLRNDRIRNQWPGQKAGGAWARGGAEAAAHACGVFALFECGAGKPVGVVWRVRGAGGGVAHVQAEVALDGGLGDAVTGAGGTRRSG